MSDDREESGMQEPPPKSDLFDSGLQQRLKEMGHPCQGKTPVGRVLVLLSDPLVESPPESVPFLREAVLEQKALREKIPLGIGNPVELEITLAQLRQLMEIEGVLQIQAAGPIQSFTMTERTEKLKYTERSGPGTMSGKGDDSLQPPPQEQGS